MKDHGVSLALHDILDGYRSRDSLISSTDLEFFPVVCLSSCSVDDKTKSYTILLQ